MIPKLISSNLTPTATNCCSEINKDNFISIISNNNPRIPCLATAVMPNGFQRVMSWLHKIAIISVFGTALKILIKLLFIILREMFRPLNVLVERLKLSLMKEIILLPIPLRNL